MKQINKKLKKCKYCKGRGLIIIEKNVKGLKECPHCNGTGFVRNDKRFFEGVTMRDFTPEKKRTYYQYTDNRRLFRYTRQIYYMYRYTLSVL